MIFHLTISCMHYANIAQNLRWLGPEVYLIIKMNLAVLPKN